MFKTLLSAIAFLLISIQAQAGILIDPYVGYIVSGDASGESVKGNEMGARLGWTMLGFGIGVDAVLAGTYNYETSGDFKPSGAGVFVSYTFPILVRGYVAYSPGMKLKGDPSTTVTGNATKVGVQYTGFPFIALGVETLSYSTTEVEIGGVTSSATGTQSQTRLAVSVPFNL